MLMEMPNDGIPIEGCPRRIVVRIREGGLEEKVPDVGLDSSKHDTRIKQQK